MPCTGHGTISTILPLPAPRCHEVYESYPYPSSHRSRGVALLGREHAPKMLEVHVGCCGTFASAAPVVTRDVKSRGAHSPDGVNEAAPSPPVFSEGGPRGLPCLIARHPATIGPCLVQR